jgi:hypothetical protein
MIWFMVMQVISTLVELVSLGRKSENEKDLEILLLRRQLAIYERKQDQAPRLSRGEKLTLVVLATKLKARTGRPHQGLDQQIPIPKTSGQGNGSVRCRNVLGGIIHDYYRDAA